MKLNIGKILKSVGMGLVKEIPGAGAVISIVNGFLPDDKKLPEDATGTQVQSAIDGLPEADRASVMVRQLDVEIELDKGWTARYQAMCAADGHSTRPQIALMMAQLMCIAIVLFSFLVWYLIYTKQPITGYAFLFGALTAIPGSVLHKYFGELRKEQGQRLDNINIT